MSPAQGRLHIRPAAHEASEQILAGGLNLGNPLVSQRRLGVGEALAGARDKRLPPVQQIELVLLRLERRRTSRYSRTASRNRFAKLRIRVTCTNDGGNRVCLALHAGKGLAALRFKDPETFASQSPWRPLLSIGITNAK
ncbi:MULTISPECIES: hypothetical protein [Bradyrhizobium]|uniref:Uncharacterized protein n=1 Tax=Bradyrhizobium elkanii TaxID=29448 RepID=A0A8I1YBV6_BRAEL|nr:MULTISPECIES: hypothetical protein [Bradyrhizobium]MBP1293658.1 hypothetical protein [Bradyrhizobium elkanii]MCP1925759.1 hypothetical protein [Bradyrhizobium elkanii]MCS3451393.1 hypothetical protein [Bradyrhizobium elkanii]MCS3476749.1 hypothetical protein [Bradyrhizobium elkanii]MCS3566582.1 hypothetical protein [Bradyrhizobium elkanii]